MARSTSILLRIFTVGTIAIAVQMVLGTVLLALAPEPTWIVFGIAALFLFGVPLGIAVTRPMPALTFPAMGLLALTGVGPAFVVDVPLVGRVVNLRLVDKIPAGHRQAERRRPLDGYGVAGYTAPGWRIDGSRALQERLSSGRGNKSYGDRRLAPLVGDGWTPAHPVEVWVAGEIRDSGRVLPSHPKFWAEPGGEFARLVGKDMSGAQLQANRAAKKFGLLAAEEPLIVMRVDSVAGAVTNQYWALLKAARFPIIGWTLMIGLALAIIRWRERPARTFG
jgi:hypothetical protein